MRFSVSEYVRWEDIDAAGIINYQAYLRFFGLAEAELFRSCGLSYKELFDEVGVWLPRVHVECDFMQPVTLDELLVVEAYFGKIGTSSITSSCSGSATTNTCQQPRPNRVGMAVSLRHALWGVGPGFCSAFAGTGVWA